MDATNAALGEISTRRNLCTNCGTGGEASAAAALATQAAGNAIAQAMRKARSGLMVTLPVLTLTGLD